MRIRMNFSHWHIDGVKSWFVSSTYTDTMIQKEREGKIKRDQRRINQSIKKFECYVSKSMTKCVCVCLCVSVRVCVCVFMWYHLIFRDHTIINATLRWYDMAWVTSTKANHKMTTTNKYSTSIRWLRLWWWWKWRKLTTSTATR